MMQTRERQAAASATPIAEEVRPNDSLDGEPSIDNLGDEDRQAVDPLDGDPLDGEPLASARDAGAPNDQERLEIVRSGRPNDEPASVAAYDDDLTTVWIPNASSGEAWLWLDLGAEKPLRAVRWLTRGSGTVKVALSSDRQRWRDVGHVDVNKGWQGIDVRDDARYVRLELLPDDNGDIAGIAEATVYGRDQAASVSSEQTSTGDGEKKRQRAARGDKSTSSQQKADNKGSPPDKGSRKDSSSKGRVDVSMEPGETNCSGKRAKCQAREGDVSVEQDCEKEGSCTIDVRADGGTASCDASGGDQTKAGDGEGKHGGRGGRCEAVADGGTVTIGDVNP